MAYLTFDKDGRSTELQLSEPVTTVGRSHEADIYFLHDRQVSRSHCQVRLRSGDFFLEHLSTKNRTLLNGDSVSSAPMRLKDGDRIEVGSNQIVFRLSLDRKPSFLARLASLFSRR